MAEKFSSISIESDGTAEGTKITINGKEIKDLSELCFSAYLGQYYQNVGISYCTIERDPQPGTIAKSQRFVVIPPSKEPEKSEASIRELGEGEDATDVLGRVSQFNKL